MLKVADNIVEKCKTVGVRFPKTWNEAQVRQAVGTSMLLHRVVKDDVDTIDEEATIAELISKYGTENESKKRALPNESEAVNDVEDDGAHAKKARKPDKITNEANRPLVDALKEMAGIYFTNKDPRKGGVFAKACKAIRECEDEITDKKQAMALKGIGKGIGGYVEEFLTTGCIMKLEELRAGTA